MKHIRLTVNEFHGTPNNVAKVKKVLSDFGWNEQGSTMWFTTGRWCRALVRKLNRLCGRLDRKSDLHLYPNY